MDSAEQLTSPLEESASAALVERHQGELQLHCYRMLGWVQDARDLVQATFMRVVQPGQLPRRRRLAGPKAHAGQLARLEPPGAFAQRQADRRSMLAAIDTGLLRRALAVARRE